jgi:ABC-type glutathione transport system ATPase component
LIGESGSGKTTLAYSLFGILPEDWICRYESWSVLGQDFQACKASVSKPGRAKKIFLVPQNPNLAFHPYKKLKAQMIDFFRYGLGEPYNEARMLDLWEEMGIAHGKLSLDRLATTLSGGEKQRICLSMAILADPEILILDEPTTGLDSATEHWVLSRVKQMAGERERGILFISHDLRIVESLATEITIMKEGSVVENLPIKDRKFEPKSEYGKALEEARRLFI